MTRPLGKIAAALMWLFGFALLTTSLNAQSTSLAVLQTTSSAEAKLALKAALVLTPEFCATKVNGFEIGKAACAELEPALKGVFSSLITAATAPSVESAQIVLLPRIVAVRETLQGRHGFEVIVTLEWNVKDTSGRIVWIDSVQGSAKHGRASVFAIKKAAMLTLEESAKDAAQQSATKMAAAPELLKFTQLAEQPQAVPETAAAKQAAPPTLPAPQVAPVPNAGAGDNLNRYTLEYIHSDRKWKHNLRTDSYDQISEDLSAEMEAEMKRKGFLRARSPDEVCCNLTVEMLTVKLDRWTSLVEVTANVKFADGRGNLIYSTEYRGRAQLDIGMEGVRHMMHRAIAAMVGNIFLDEAFYKAITKASNAGAR
jgi:hypothetical protein